MKTLKEMLQGALISALYILAFIGLLSLAVKARYLDFAPKAITATIPAAVRITYTRDGMVEIETDRCLLVVNTKKRTSYQRCADGNDIIAEKEIK